MAKLTKKEVLHVARLANLPLEEKETGKYLEQLTSIVEFVGTLNEVDTVKLTETSQTTGLEDVYRKDEVETKSVLSQEEATSGTEAVHNGYFKVKTILAEKT